MAKRVRCYGCDGKAAKGNRFCTKCCAADYAEALVEGNDDAYCDECDTWNSIVDGELSCGHEGEGRVTG